MAAVMQNMGPTDRVVRGVMGAAMLWNGLQYFGNSPGRKIETFMGGAFLVYGLTGFDPLLKAFGATTIGGRENNVLNRFRAMLPGPGIKPALTDYVKPKKPLLRLFREDLPLSKATAIG